MAKKIAIKIFADPGHAWARFPKAKLVQLGIADKISTYSYQNGSNAFLEEDCDLSTLISALRERGYEIRFNESHTNRQSKIRNYETYKTV
jgi:N-acetyl-anhydromuramyl-L-alanine amidase AmpD